MRPLGRIVETTLMDLSVSSVQRHGNRLLFLSAGLLVSLALPVSGCSGSVDSSADQDDGDGDGDGNGGSGQSGGRGGSNPGGNTGGTTPPIIEPPTGCESVEPLPPVVRRLTQKELLNSLRDILGVNLTADTAEFPKETITGFSTDVKALIPNFEFTKATVTLGEKVAEKIQDKSAFAQKFGSCNGFGDACEKAFVEELGLRLFRRPLTEEQVGRYRKILADAKAQNVSFADATPYVLEAMLGSASFLYRSEPEVGDGSYRGLDDYQIASRLSFSLWATSPDDELMGKAREGKLTNASEREAQVERMLNDNRAKQVFATYASDWLVLEEASKGDLDQEMYPEYTSELGEKIVEETRAFIEAFWDEGLPHHEIYTAKFAFADRKMAEIYGFENPRDGLTRYDLKDDPYRFGILTQAAVLGPSGVHPKEPSIVFRGQYILKRFLCTEPPELTQAVRDALGDQIAENAKITEGNSQRFAADARKGTCAACHNQFDTLAYAFEPYDGLGRRREKDRLGNALRTDGRFPGVADPEEKTFGTTEEFATGFATLPLTRACLVANALHFLAGQAVHLDDERQSCLVNSIRQSMEKPDASFKDLFRAVALHPTNQGFNTLQAP